MVYVSEPTFPGCVIPVKVIALFRMRDDEGVDDKVVCVPQHDPNWNVLSSLDDIADSLRDEISHFFSIYRQPEGIAVKVDGWYPARGGDADHRRVARALARAARRRRLSGAVGLRPV
jgi:inorganic pyrophosphatase